MEEADIAVEDIEALLEVAATAEDIEVVEEAMLLTEIEEVL